MHEIDEGLRLIARLGCRREAQSISNFSNSLHLTQRLELLRQILATVAAAELPPEKLHSVHKARNNQCGAIQSSLGRHPAVAVTDVGVEYKNRNEDGFLFMEAQKVLVLADGMGGHVAGDVASGIAIDFLEAGIRQGMELAEAIVFANDAILTRTQHDPGLRVMHPMGCTIAAIQLKHTTLRVAHVGDSKVMVIRRGKIIFESEDHTQGQELLREGLIDKHTAMELNHVLNRCLGLDSMRAERDVGFASPALTPGDRVLLATDGITDNFFRDNFSLEELAELAASGSLVHAAEVILDQSQHRMRLGTLPDGRPAKGDNLSLALMEFQG